MAQFPYQHLHFVQGAYEVFLNPFEFPCGQKEPMTVESLIPSVPVKDGDEGYLLYTVLPLSVEYNEPGRLEVSGYDFYPLDQKDFCREQVEKYRKWIHLQDRPRHEDHLVPLHADGSIQFIPACGYIAEDAEVVAIRVTVRENFDPDRYL